MREHANKFLHIHKICYGNVSYTEFKDEPFLTEHVKYISVCDTDLLDIERQVMFLGGCYFPLCSIYGHLVFPFVFMMEACCVSKLRYTGLFLKYVSAASMKPNFYCIWLQVLDLSECALNIHVYQLQEDGPGQEELDDEDLAAANHWLLPSADFSGLWDSLVFDSSVKAQVDIFTVTKP